MSASATDQGYQGQRHGVPLGIRSSCLCAAGRNISRKIEASHANKYTPQVIAVLRPLTERNANQIGCTKNSPKRE